MFDTVYVHVESGNKIAGFWSSQNDLYYTISVAALKSSTWLQRNFTQES